MPIRPDSQRVEVYNEGLAVYLHDPANAGAILEANPPSILGLGDVEPAKDKALKKLVERGALVTYYLRQDDPIVVDVLVGAPLDKQELKRSGLPWLRPQQTVISLPSGRLRIDTPNTFRLSADAQAYAKEYKKEHGRPPADEDIKAFGLFDASGEVRVPPGDYVLTLYRVNFDKLETEGDYEGPGEIITLTPAAELERPKKVPPVLEYGAGHTLIKGLRTCKVVDGVFHGRALGGNAVNLTWKHAQRLGLRRGQRLRVTHEGKRYDAVFLGGIEPRTDPELLALVYPDKLEGLRRESPELLTAALAGDIVVKMPLLRLQSMDPKQWLTGEPNTEVVIEPTDEFLLPAPESPPAQPQGKLENGEVRGEVLACGPEGIELSCSPQALKPLLTTKAVELRLRVGEVEVPLLVLPGAEHRHRLFHIANSVRMEASELFGRVFAYMVDGGDDVFRACVGQERSKALTGLLREYKTGCRFSAREGYVPKDEDKAEALRNRCVALWKEGAGRWNVPGSMQALFATHWDGPPATTLSCRPIGRAGKDVFRARPGDGYALSRREAE